MSKDSVEVNCGCGCLLWIAAAIILWALLFGITYKGETYIIEGCSIEKGVIVE